jgi:SAM-dependent methyltransferase
MTATHVISFLKKSSLVRTCYFKSSARTTVWIDRMLNIDTVSLPAKPISRSARFDDAFWYEGFSYLKLWRYVRLVKPSDEDVVFDVGCGMGRILCVFARRPVKKCIGIEVSAELAERARQNALRLRGRRAPIEIIVADAAEADYSDGTIYCLYNPFGARTLSVVMARIRESVKSHPRRIDVIYFNALCDNVLQSCRWLRCYHRRESLFKKQWGTTSLWTNEDAQERS